MKQLVKKDVLKIEEVREEFPKKEVEKIVKEMEKEGLIGCKK